MNCNSAVLSITEYSLNKIQSIFISVAMLRIAKCMKKINKDVGRVVKKEGFSCDCVTRES